MVERNIIVAMLLIAIAFSVSGYIVGQFLTQEEQSTSNTTSIITSTITKTSNSTKTVLQIPPNSLSSNSTAVVKSRFVLNGSVFLMLTIDKSTISQGETLQIKSTVSNLVSHNVQLDIDVNIISVYNNTGKLVWTFSENFFASGFGPNLHELWIDLGPNCLAGILSLWEYRQLNNTESPEDSCKYSIDEATIKWNITGLHTETEQLSGITKIRTIYDEQYLPEGQYTLIWEPTLKINEQKENIRETISFTITKQD